MARVLVGLLPLAEVQVHRRETTHRLSCIALRIDLDRDCKRCLEVLDRLLRLAEEQVQPAEVDEQPADVPFVLELLEELLRLLGVVAGEEPVARALGDERCLEVGVGHHRAVAEALRQLECALDVLARRLEVALAPMAPGAPVEDVRSRTCRTAARSFRRA